jgi:hypothetical protein
VERVEVRARTGKPGKAADWTVRVLGANGKLISALQPIELAVTARNGIASPEYGGWHVADSGELRLQPVMAVNDWRGTWRVQATELASGVSGQAEFTVRE